MRTAASVLSFALLAVLGGCGTRPSEDPGRWAREESPPKDPHAVTAKPRSALKGHAGSVTCLAFSPDGKTLASGGTDGAVKLWGVVSASERPAVKYDPKEWVTSLVLTQGGKVLAASRVPGDEKTNVWRLSADGRQRVLEIPGRIDVAAFSPDGTGIASGSGGQARVWDLAAGRQRIFPGAPRHQVGSLVFSADGRTLAAGGSNPQYAGEVKVWKLDADGAGPLIVWGGAAVESIALGPDGKALAAGGLGGRITLWDAGTGKVLRDLEKRHATEPVTALAFSPDGRLLASVCRDKTARLWDVNTGRQRVVCEGHGSAITCVAFSRDGKTLATGGTDKTVLLWDVPPD